MIQKYFRRKRRQRYFFRGKQGENDKVKYIGNILRTDPYHWVLASSWLFRFGGYTEIRIYDPKTKKRVGIFNLEEFNDYCQKKNYNDFVLKNGIYLNIGKVSSR